MRKEKIMNRTRTIFCEFKYDSRFFFHKELKYNAGHLDKEVRNRRSAEENQESNSEHTKITLF